MTRWDVVRQVCYVAVFASFTAMMIALMVRGIYAAWFGEDFWQMLVYMGAGGGCGSVTDSVLRQANKHLEEINRREELEP